jgi:hypothetical protein
VSDAADITGGDAIVIYARVKTEDSKNPSEWTFTSHGNPLVFVM